MKTTSSIDKKNFKGKYKRAFSNVKEKFQNVYIINRYNKQPLQFALLCETTLHNEVEGCPVLKSSREWFLKYKMVLVYLYEHRTTKSHEVQLCSHIPEQGIGSAEFVEIVTNGLAFTLPACIKNFTIKSKICQNSWLSQWWKIYQLIFDDYSAEYSMTKC